VQQQRQMLIVGGPNTSPESKMANGRHFGKPLNCNTYAIVLRILMKFGTMTCFSVPHSSALYQLSHVNNRIVKRIRTTILHSFAKQTLRNGAQNCLSPSLYNAHIIYSQYSRINYKHITPNRPTCIVTIYDIGKVSDNGILF